MGCLPGPRLPQDRAGDACRTGRHASMAFSCARAGSRPTGSPARSRRPTAPTATSIRCRTRIAHIRTWTFVGQPARLAGRSGTLAGGHPRDRGQVLRRLARAPDRTLHRPPHQRADAALARKRDARAGDQQNRRGRRRRAWHRPARRLHVRAGSLIGWIRSEGVAERRAEGARGRDRRARRASCRSAGRAIRARRPTVRCAGPAPPSASWSRARKSCARASASSPTSI